MCGRYTLRKRKAEFEERFAATFQGYEAIQPNYNACPTTFLPVITNVDRRTILLAQWGIVPPWEKNTPKPKRLINATLERINEAKPFKDLIGNKRCIVLADGYFEWKEVRKGYKIPYFVQVKGGELFAFAALYDVDELSNRLTFSLITHPPTAQLAFIHHRMPGILAPEQEQEWLESSISVEEAQKLISKYLVKEMGFYAVTRELNSSFENNPKFVVPADHTIAEQGSLF